MKRPGLALLLLPLLACGDDQRPNVGDTPPPPATTNATATGPAPTSAEGTTASQPCDCAPDQFCGAYFVPGDPPPEPDAFSCLDECIAEGVPGFWCFDDASCCAGSCRADGLCGSPIADTTTGPGTTTDASSSGGSSSGGSSSGAASSSGSSSSSGDSSTTGV